jgi:hypothetical protein
MKHLRVLLVALAAVSAPLMATSDALAQASGSDVYAANSAIMNAGSRAAAVRDIDRVPSVGVVRLDFNPVVSSSSDLPSRAEYRILASRNAAGVSRLQQALRANPATRSALDKRGIDPGQVVGAQVASNGSLRLYVLSR